MDVMAIIGLLAGPLKELITTRLQDNPLWSGRIAELDAVAGEILDTLSPAIQAAIAEKLQGEMERVAKNPERAARMALIRADIKRLEAELEAE